MDFKSKHPQGFDWFSIPKEIGDWYRSRFDYGYVDIAEHIDVPMPDFMWFRLMEAVEEGSVKFENIPLAKYVEGFTDGYNQTLIPFIDTPDNRKFAIIAEINKSPSSFKLSIPGLNGEKKMYTEDAMYEGGFFEGKRYKAWEIVFSNPRPFLEHLLASIEQKQSIGPNPTNVSEYIIDISKIATLHNRYDGQIWEEISYVDFLSCFDLANAPTAKITYKSQTNFVYILANINAENGKQKVNKGIALHNFNIKMFDQHKSKALKATHTDAKLKRDLLTILNGK